MAGDQSKRLAAVRALDFIEAGMTVGLGTGSTAEHFVELLADRASGGLALKCVSTSERTAKLATGRGLEVVSLDDVEQIHVTVDGADEVDPSLQLIKGGGGALLREKIVASASQKMIVIVDESKMVQSLGAFPLPVEVVPFGLLATERQICDALRAEQCPGQDVHLRKGKGAQPFITDGGHYILDCLCEVIPDPESLGQRLSQIPGVVDHGLFIGLASCVIVGREDHAYIINRD